MVEPQFHSVRQQHKQDQQAYRLINSKFPPIALFDDVADADEFEVLYALQSLTNPRLQNQLGNLNLLPQAQIPFGIVGCSYACAPFTHVNPNGSRFSDGSFGVLYLADCIETALAEVTYHQQAYWQNVTGLHYDTIVLRALQVIFSAELTDLSHSPNVPDSPFADIYQPNDYRQSRALGASLKKQGAEGIQYHSVRLPGGICWGLLTPKNIASVVQTSHYELIFDGQQISSVRQISAMT